MSIPMLGPVLALVTWTLVICGWLYAARIPAISRHNVIYDPARPAHEFHDQLPAEVRWKADNYNNLMEQPTLFYVVALTLALLGATSWADLALAWIYVGARILHSIIQVTVNKVALRFPIFLIATLVLLTMAGRASLMMLLK